MNEKEVSISVVIPTYNRAKTITYCLDSVFKQSFPPYEVIIVDDCSTDDTVLVVRDYKDERVRCIVLDNNSGAQAARNRGIIEAKGEWIAFQDSDDEWDPDKLKKQVEVIEGFNFDPWTVVHTNALLYNLATETKTVYTSTGLTGEHVHRNLLQEPGPLFPTLLVSKVALEKINYLDEGVPSFQEWDTCIRLSKYCRFIFLEEPLFIYYLHSGITISKDKGRDLRGYRYIIYKFEPEIREHCDEEVWQKHLLIIAEKSLENGLWQDASKLLKEINLNNFTYQVLRLSLNLKLPPSQLFRKIEFFRNFISRVRNKARKVMHYKK